MMFVYCLTWAIIAAVDTAIYGGHDASVRDAFNHASVYTTLGFGIPWTGSTPMMDWGSSINPESTRL